MAGDDSNPYRRLGVEPSATTAEIHTAYRALAARFHPDRQSDATEADRQFAERRMREINQAWAILRDPGRRRAHDLSRGGPRRTASDGAGSTGGSGSGPIEPGDVEPGSAGGSGWPVDIRLGLFRGLPWIALVAVLVTIAILTAYADRAPTPTDRPAPTVVVEIGSCIDIEAGPSTTVVPCDGPHEHRIVDRVPRPADCPRGTEARRLGTDGRFDCLVYGDQPAGGR